MNIEEEFKRELQKAEKRVFDKTTLKTGDIPPEFAFPLDEAKEDYIEIFSKWLEFRIQEKQVEIGKWVEIESGEYEIIAINECGDRLLTSETFNIEEKEKGLVIGEVWLGSVAYNVKIVDESEEEISVYILEVKSENLEIIENPLNNEGIGW